MTDKKDEMVAQMRALAHHGDNDCAWRAYLIEAADALEVAHMELAAAGSALTGLRDKIACHEAALDGALAALAGSGICTPAESFKRAPSGSLGTCIRNLRDERDALKAKLAACQNERAAWAKQAGDSQRELDRTKAKLAEAEARADRRDRGCDVLLERAERAEAEVAALSPLLGRLTELTNPLVEFDTIEVYRVRVKAQAALSQPGPGAVQSKEKEK